MINPRSMRSDWFFFLRHDAYCPQLLIDQKEPRGYFALRRHAQLSTSVTQNLLGCEAREFGEIIDFAHVR
jgi:hypothetical protein